METLDLDFKTNRNGKIAHLPRDLRERINLALYKRAPAKHLVHALNQMPEVKTVMARHFDGRPLKSQNIYEWKNGGYRDWVHRREILENKRELSADTKDLADTANGMADSLFGLLTLDYAQLLKDRDGDTPEAFEKKRKALSALAQDIVRLRRCHLNARRVEVQEARLERDDEKTEEQLLLKFAEWTDNPAVRHACILAPMERDRRRRQLFNLPPAPEDPLVEMEIQNDPWFNPPDKKPTKNKPIPTEKTESATKEPQRGSIIQPGVGTPVPTPGQDPNNSPNPEGVVSDAESNPTSPPTTQNSPLLNYAGKPTIIAEIEEQHARKHAANLESTSSMSSMPSTSSTPPGSSLVTHQPHVASSLRKTSFYGPCPAPGDNWKVKTA